MSGLRQAGAVWVLITYTACLAPAGAAHTKEIATVTAAGLSAGRAIGVAITAEGALRAAPSLTRLMHDQAGYVWSLVADGEGGAFAATGSEGRVYHATADSSGALLVETFEYELFALTRSPKGHLYFAGAPNGTILRSAASGGEPETILDLPEGLVWDLLFAPDGTLFAATGDKGDVYRIKPNGEKEAIGRVPDAHAVELAWQNGSLICGTDSRGLLVAMDPGNGKIRVLYDTGREEVVALLPLEDGSLLFAANGDGEANSGSRPAGPVSSDGALVLPAIEVHANGGEKGAGVFQRLPNGLVREVWNCPEQDILDLCVAPDGSVLVATGERGLLFALDSLWNATRILDLNESQILSLASDGRRVFLGTGNGGSVYCLDWDAPRQGIFTSDVIRADQTVQWGAPDWITSGDGRLDFETRSGQLSEPDESWSDWQPLAGGRIQSPAARFLQWRIRMSSPANGGLQVRQVAIPYRGANRAPEIRKIEVTPLAPELSEGNGAGGTVRQTLPSGVEIEYSLQSGRSSEPVERAGIWARSLRSAVWDAIDPDADPLRFDLYLWAVDNDQDARLAKDVEDQAYTWDAAVWPDGWYELRVVASDAKGNSVGEAMRDERRSAPFRIDNTPPSLSLLRIERVAEGAFITGTASDEGRLETIEVSADGENWQPASPTDGIVDGVTEDFRIPIPLREDGTRPTHVGIRIADKVGHVTARRVAVPGD